MLLLVTCIGEIIKILKGRVVMSNTYNPQKLATVLGVPTNVANATQKVDRTDYAKVSSSSSSNAYIGSAYDAT